MRTIFDEGSMEVLAEALEILEGTERMLVVNNPVGGPCLKNPRDAVREYSFALAGEVHELADELGWKSWKTPKPVDVPRAFDEFADVLAFLGVMTQLTLHLSGDYTHLDLARAFGVKSAVNIERINTGTVPGYIGEVKRASQLHIGDFYTVTTRGQLHQRMMYIGEDPGGNYNFLGEDKIQLVVYPLEPDWQVERIEVALAK